MDNPETLLTVLNQDGQSETLLTILNQDGQS